MPRLSLTGGGTACCAPDLDGAQARRLPLQLIAGAAGRGRPGGRCRCLVARSLTAVAALMGDYRRYQYDARVARYEAETYKTSTGAPEQQGSGASASSVGRVRALAVVCTAGFVSCVAGGFTFAPWTELLMQTACARQNVTFGTHACDVSAAAQHEATYRNSFLNVGTQLSGFLS